MENNEKNTSAISDTLNNLYTIDGAISRTRRKRTIWKVSFSVVSFLSLLFIVLYLFLPVFQTSNMSVDGLINFETSDFISLSGLDSYCPLAFMDTKKAEEKAVSSSKPFFRSVSITSDGLKAKAEVLEEKPVAKVGENIYFSSGNKSDEILTQVSSLDLPAVEIEKIRENIGNEITSSLPLIHFPEGITQTDSNIALSVNKLISVPYSILTEVSDIQYINEGKDDQWNNVLSFLVRYEGECYWFKSVLTDTLPQCFTEKNTPYVVAQYCKESVEKNADAKKTEIVFEDTKESVSAYVFRIYFSGDVIISMDNEVN